MRKILHGSDEFEPRSDVIDGRRDGGEARDEVFALPGDKEKTDRKDENVEDEIREYAAEFFAREHAGLVPHGDDAMRVDDAFDLGECGFPEDDDASDFDAATRGSRACADEHEHEEDAFGKGGPRLKIYGDKARGGHDGRRGKRTLAQGSEEIADEGEIFERHKEARSEKNLHISHKFAAFRKDPAAGHKLGIVEVEIDAERKHAEREDPFDGRGLKMRDRCIVRRKSARPRGGKGRGERIEEIHARDEKDDGEDHGHADIDRIECARRVRQTRSEFAEFAGHFGF